MYEVFKTWVAFERRTAGGEEVGRGGRWGEGWAAKSQCGTGSTESNYI